MATNNKDFKVKHGLIVEGAQGTINNQTILTEADGDAYILGLVGGSTLITSVDTDDFTVTAGLLTVAAGSDIARDGDITTAIDALDTDDIEEGSTNLYYTDTRARGAITAGTGIDYNSATGYIDANLGTGLGLDGSSQIEINRTTVDTWYDASGAAAAAQAAAEAYADGLAGNYDPAGTAAAEVAALVNGAPELLDTLNELAEAINDDASFASTIATSIGEKQDTLTAGDNINITGATISVTGLDSADISDFNTAALSATASAYDATGTAQGIVDALDTDDIEEGLANQYFTDGRAKTSAAQLLTGATLDNITITGDENGLTITAENGVADSDTDDLDEGTTNLYFQDSRAVDALEAVVPNFTAVEINSVAKQVAATVSVATASQVTAYEFLGTEYRSAKFLVKTAQGSHTDVAEVLLTMDSSNNISITEYAMVGTNGSLMTITADYVSVGTTVRLRVTTANNTSVVTVVGTLLA
jgi:hypothetical protein